jgi:uncharacterized phosphosugar-binding protein
MATIVTRSGKGSPLTHTEMDANFTNLDADKAGYTTAGDGSAVTQETTKTNAVVMNNKCGKITMYQQDTINAGAVVNFTLTNNTIQTGDVLILNHSGVGTFGAYLLNAKCADGSAVIYVTNISSSNHAEAIEISFALVQARHD